MLRWIAWSVAGLIMLLATTVVIYVHRARPNEGDADRLGPQIAARYMASVDARLKAAETSDQTFVPALVPALSRIAVLSVQRSGPTAAVRLQIYVPVRSLLGEAALFRCYLVRFGSTSQPRITPLRPCPTATLWRPSSTGTTPR
jgi:hypothetical protein